MAASGASRGFEALTRTGFAARGVMYGLIGWLALDSGRSEDGAGVIDHLGSGDGGGAVLLAMAAGFLAYGLWRLLDAWQDSDDHGTDAKGLAVRAGGIASGLVHFVLGFLALRHALGGGGSGGDSSRAGAETALDLPGGWLLLILAAAALLAIGGYQLVKARTLGFMRRLDAPPSSHGWLCWLGRAGFAARGIVFLVVGWLFFRAGSEARASEAGGLAQALDSVPAELRVGIAAGLLLFGLFSLAEARYRRIRSPLR